MPRRQGRGETWLRANAGYQGEGCLIYPFYRSPQRGYALIGIGGKMVYAHRFMCELVNGPSPSSQHQAGHSCGRGHAGCVHPLHLSWKTNSDNQRDRRRHGTHLGAKGSRTRLSPEQVAQMRALKGRETIETIAQRFGVKRGCVEYWHKHSRPPVPRSQRVNRASGASST